MSRTATLALASFFCASGGAFAEDYPSQPIQVVVPYAAGGITDVSVRMVAERLEAVLGQPVVVENRPGAATTVASAWVASQPADGYTLYAASLSMGLNPLLQDDPGYQPFEDFTYIAGLVDSPMILTASDDLGVTNMEELVELVEENPDVYAIGASGVGAINHIAAEYWLEETGLDVAVVQHQGGAEVRQGLLSGYIDMTFASANEAKPLLESGDSIAIATATRERLDEMPEVPTVEEALDLDYFEAVFWTLLAGPAGMPEDRVSKLQEAMEEIAADEDLRERLAEQGVLLNVTGAEDVTARMHDAVETYSPIIESFRAQ